MAFAHPVQVPGIRVNTHSILPLHTLPRALTAVSTGAWLLCLAISKLVFGRVVVPVWTNSWDI
jgi:hypothetical protein